MNPVELIATIPVRLGCAEEVLRLLVAYGEHVRSAAGTKRFEVFTDRDDPLTLVVIERYVDETAFQAHLDDPANADFNAAIAPLTQGGSALRFLTRAYSD